MDLQRLLLDTAKVLGLPTTALSLTYQDWGKDGGGWAWSAQIKVPYKSRGKTFTRSFAGDHETDPALAMRDACESYHDWKDPKRVKEANRKAMLREMAKETTPSSKPSCAAPASSPDPPLEGPKAP